jgi:hypothetical protein
VQFLPYFLHVSVDPILGDDFVDIIPVFLDNFLRFFEHDKKHGFLIVINGLQVQPIAQVAFESILHGKSSLTISCTCWNEYNFLPKLYKFRPILCAIPNPYHICVKPQILFSSQTYVEMFM